MPGLGRCCTRPAPTVADTIGGTTASPQTVVGAPASDWTSSTVKPMAVANPSVVPSTQPIPSRTTATSASAGTHDGSTVAVADPTASIPIETMPHSGSAPTRTLAASVPGWRTARAAKPAVKPTSSSQPSTSSTRATHRPGTRVWVSVARIAVPITAPYQAGPTGGSAVRVGRGASSVVVMLFSLGPAGPSR